MARIRVAEEVSASELRVMVMKRVLLTVTMTLIFTLLIYAYFPFNMPQLNHSNDRIVFTLRCNVLSVLCVAIMIAYIGNTRFMSEQINPLSLKDKHLVEVPQRILQNTLEQFAMSFTLQLAACTWLTSVQMKIIPIIVMWFVLGRILFWFGYMNSDYGRTRRAFGFTLSMQPSAVLAIYCLTKLLCIT